MKSIINLLLAFRSSDINEISAIAYVRQLGELRWAKETDSRTYMNDISNKQEFIEYLENHPEKGLAYPNIQYHKLHDISPNEFIKLKSWTISFDQYDKFLLLIHPDTDEIFLGDMNDGGHAVVCRIIKIHREDFFTKQSELKKWYDKRAWKMWEQ
jgi:hypothetical protein